MKNLSYYDYDEELAVDIECKDPNLLTKGNGVYRKDGYIIGVSFSNGDLSEYYPIAHPDTTPKEKEKNYKYIVHQLEKPTGKIFAGGLYDLDWLVNFEGLKVNGHFDDVQVMEPLLDEYRRTYNLNDLSLQYLGTGKTYNKVREYAIQQGFITEQSKKGSEIGCLWRMPASEIGDYPDEDARLTYLLKQKQRPLIDAQNLHDVYDMEMRLWPLLLQMRRTGVRIHEENLYKTGLQLADIQFDLQEDLNKIAGFKISVNSSNNLENLFLSLGIPVQYNEPTDRMILNDKLVGNPTFKKEVLQTVDNPIAKKILELRHITTLLSLFIHPYPEMMVDGRLHCQFNQLRSDNYGTVSGRFSSSNPNLQQVSAKDENDHIHGDSEILNGLVIRRLFIPENGHDWLKLDWSQIEYRLIAHYATGPGSEEIRRRYNEDPNTDYHNEVGLMTGIDNRKTVKNFNFGKAYSMGVRTMALKFNLELEVAEALNKQYDRALPFLKQTSYKVSQKAKRIGFVKTIMGRRARLVNSSKAYVMFNRLIQGSAADLMKKAMVESHEAGVFNSLKPHLTVHDEMDSSMPRTTEGYEAGKELKSIMENCLSLKIPIIADAEIGKNWGELEKWEYGK